ncbi:MAG TPA: FAD-binding oxidoreductase [Solirubrobacteraceae bacterium]|nr:FAD-binding oxidoreductase [Solirubrobacteraceae bacterium]
MRTGELGHWWRSLGGAQPSHPPLRGAHEADVAIVGGGLTGLWSAYHLARAEPSLRIVLLEGELLGFGASGRNGGWVSGFFSGPARSYERHGGRGAYLALQREMFATVGQIIEAVEQHGIEADLVHGGVLTAALGQAQAANLREEVLRAHALGLAEDDLRLLSACELAGRVRVLGASAGSFSPHVARVHPAKLVRGLARVVADLGVQIHEETRVTAIEPRLALSAGGRVAARWVIRATEGYTGALPGLRRALAPVNSSMIVTEPLSAAAWEEIGWDGCEALADGAHVYAYLQRTADGRIAIGGRGVPYRYGSRTNGRGTTPARTAAGLTERLHAMFPAARGTAIAHAWSGVLGVPRDWCVSVQADPRTGLAWAGGYVGEGVAASHLAARILRDLVLGRESELTALPWVGREPPRWEPEPLRWLGIRGLYSLYRAADRLEALSGRPSRLAGRLDALSGRA